MDVIRAHQHGFTNAVASCGTALTPDQARTLKKFCGEVVFVYDGDDAGQKAMLRGTEILLESEFHVRIVALPAEHDPDTFLVEQGTEAFAREVSAARDFMDFFLASAQAKFDTRTPAGKVQAVDFVLPLLNKIRSEIARHAYAQRVAERLDIDEALVRRQVGERTPRDVEKLEEEVRSLATPRTQGREDAAAACRRVSRGAGRA